MSDDYDYEEAPENLSPGDIDESRGYGPDYEYDPYDHFDEELEIQKAERDYEKYIDRMMGDR